MKATPDELKYYASICKKGNCSSQCPYNDYERCVETMMIDALAYIEQLESRAKIDLPRGESDEPNAKTPEADKS